jgi:hypothetical protein
VKTTKKAGPWEQIPLFPLAPNRLDVDFPLQIPMLFCEIDVLMKHKRAATIAWYLTTGISQMLCFSRL